MFIPTQQEMIENLLQGGVLIIALIVLVLFSIRMDEVSEEYAAYKIKRKIINRNESTKITLLRYLVPKEFVWMIGEKVK